MDWTFDPGWEAHLRPLLVAGLTDPSGLPGYRLIKQNNARSVFRFDAGGSGFVVKRFTRSSGAARWKERLLGAVAGREWARLRLLAARGVPVPPPAACWTSPTGESGLVTVEVREARPWKELLLADRSPAAISRTLAAAAALVARAHEAGFLHADLHVGNFLIDPTGRLTLIDVHRGAVRARISLRERLGNLALLGFSLGTVLPRTAWRRLLRSYLAELPNADRAVDPRRCAEWIAGRIAALSARHLRRRTRRCLKSGTGFRVHETTEWRVYALRPLDPGQVLRVVLEHDARLGPPGASAGAVVKETSRVKLTREVLSTPEGERPVFVKAFRAAGLRLRLKRALGADPGKRAWVAAQGLKVRGLPTPDALAFVEPLARTAPRNTYLVTAARPSASPLDRYVVERFARDERSRAARDAFLGELADLLRRLHSAGVQHHDLKANNVLVRNADGRPGFELIDLDRLSFARSLPLDARLVNLAQLNAATPGVITRTDRLRCFLRYAAGNPDLAEWRPAVARIMKLTIARRHVWPVRPD